MKRPKTALILLAIVAIAGVVFLFAPFLSQRWAFSPYGDTIYLTGPLFCDISRSVQMGTAPLMNWSSFEALDYNPHVAAYYPLYLFGWLDFCSAAASAQAADIIAVVHIAIFALTMASLIRATGASLLAAIVGACIAATLPNIYAMAVFPTFITAVAWLPLAIEGLVRLYYRRQFALGSLLLAAGTGAMLTAGPGTNLLSALVLVALVMSIDTLVRLALAKDVATGIRLAIALVAAGAITAILVLASTIHLFSHIDEIIRWTRSGSVVGRARIGVSEILTEQLTWRELPQLIVPIQAAYAAGTYLLGPVVILLSLLGAVTGWSKPVVRVFAILAAVCVVLVFLSPSFVVMLWAVTPGLSHTRHLSLVGMPLAIGAGVLSAYGVASLVQEGPRLRSRFPVMAAASLVVFAASILVLRSGVALSSVYPLWGLIALAGATALIIAILPRLDATLPRLLGVAALLVLQFVFIAGSTPHNDGMPVLAKSPTWQSIQAALDHIEKTDPAPGRVALHTSIDGGPGLSYMDAGSIATYMGLPTFTHYTTPRIYWKFSHEISLVGSNDFARFGGKYLLSSAILPASLGEQVFQAGDIRVYLLNNRRPLVAAICLQPSELAVPEGGGLRAPAGQLRLLDGPIVAAIAALNNGSRDCRPGDSQAAEIDRGGNAVDFTIPPGPERLLVISLPPYASWQLWAGGRRLPLYNLREQQMVAFVPQDVSGPASLIYRPRDFWWRSLVSKIGWAAVIMAIAGVLAWPRLRPALPRHVR